MLDCTDDAVLGVINTERLWVGDVSFGKVLIKRECENGRNTLDNSRPDHGLVSATSVTFDIFKLFTGFEEFDK